MPYAAYRSCGIVVAPDRQSAMRISRKACMGDVDTHPAGKIDFLHPNIHPCMARSMFGIARIDIAGNVARRDAMHMAAGQEQVGMVLADALAKAQGI